MMLASKLLAVPYLSHAVHSATHIRNITPSAGISITPRFAMFGTHVAVDRRQVFGCTAWVFVPPNMQKGNWLSAVFVECSSV